MVLVSCHVKVKDYCLQGRDTMHDGKLLSLPSRMCTGEFWSRG